MRFCIMVLVAVCGCELDLAVTEAIGGACDLTKRSVASVGNGSQAVTFNAVSGNVYFIVVDGPAYVAHDFTRSVDCQ